MSAQPIRPHDPGGPRSESPVVLETLRGAITEEFQIAERLDSKAAAYLQLGGIWFAVVQAVAIPLVDRGGVDRRWLAGAALIGLLAAASLAYTTYLTFRVLSLRPEIGINPDTAEEMLTHQRDPGFDAEMGIVRLHARVLRERRAQNILRAADLTRVAQLWGCTVALAFIELAFAVATRVFG